MCFSNILDVFLKVFFNIQACIYLLNYNGAEWP